MHNTLRLLAVVLLGFLSAACGSARHYTSASPVTASPATKPGLAMASEGAAANPGFDDFGSVGKSGEDAGLRAGLVGAYFDDGHDGDIRARTENLLGRPAVTAERMLVYNGQITVEVARTEEAMAQFLARLVAWGGYLQAQDGTQLTVRLPASHFDAALAHLRGSGRVLHESRKADDVTEEFLDIGIRLDNAKQSRERLIEILQKAEKVEDILAVEKELRRLTDEIERMEGRRKYLADQVAMATLQASFQAVAEAPPPQKRRRQPSRFEWLNLIGAERVMEDF